MKIAVTGTPNRIAELRKKLPSKHELIEVKNKNFKGADLVFDLNFDDFDNRIEDYAYLKGIPVVVCALKRQLEQEIAHYASVVECHLIGMNALPTFIDRELTEVCCCREEDKELFNRVATELEWKPEWVKSRVGMVTPRIIFMIINEAFYTLQEGTATKEDIDTGMKLGTAYPFGPFEWCEKVGVKNVYEVLSALRADTGDERYKVCPELKTAYYRTSSSM